MTTHVSVKLLGSAKSEFVVPNHAPTLMRYTYCARGILEKDGRILIPADQPIPSYYPEPENIISVEIIKPRRLW